MEKTVPPTDLPKFPDVDSTAFLKADNHHKNVIEKYENAEWNRLFNFGIGALKRIDMEVRPAHCARYDCTVEKINSM